MKKTILLLTLLSFYSCNSSDTLSDLANKQNGTVVTDPGALGGQDVKGIVLPSILGKEGACNAVTGGQSIQGYIRNDYDGVEGVFQLNIYAYNVCGQQGNGRTLIASVNYVVDQIVFTGSNTFKIKMKLKAIIDQVAGDPAEYAKIEEVSPNLMSSLQAMVGEDVYWNVELDPSVMYQNEIKYPSLQDISQPSSAEEPIEATEEYQYPAAPA